MLATMTQGGLGDDTPTAVAPPVKSIPGLSVAEFNQIIFPPAGNVAAARQQLEFRLNRRLEGIGKSCNLTTPQIEKLRLAGSGDIERFFGCVDRLRETLGSPQEEALRDESLLEARGLHRVYVAEFAGGNSLFCKAIKRTLTPDQMQQYRESKFFLRTPVALNPNRLPLGIVHVGATVEASTRVVLKGDVPADIEFRAEPPDWIRIRRTATGIGEYGRWGVCTHYDLLASVDTSRAGTFEGTIAVFAGDERIDVPITVSIREEDRTHSRLLVVQAPVSRGMTDDAALFDPWLELVERSQLDVHYWDIDPAAPVLRGTDLAGFDVVLFEALALLSAHEEDLERLSDFARSGGRLVLSASYYFYGTVPKANAIANRFGLTIAQSEHPGRIPIEQTGIVNDELTKGITRLSFMRPSPISILDGSKARILVSAPGQPDRGYLAIAPAERGEVILFSNATLWSWPKSKPDRPDDNSRLLQNVLTRRRTK